MVSAGMSHRVYLRLKLVCCLNFLRPSFAARVPRLWLCRRYWGRAYCMKRTVRRLRLWKMGEAVGTNAKCSRKMHYSFTHLGKLQSLQGRQLHYLRETTVTSCETRWASCDNFSRNSSHCFEMDGWSCYGHGA